MKSGGTPRACREELNCLPELHATASAEHNLTASLTHSLLTARIIAWSPPNYGFGMAAAAALTRDCEVLHSERVVPQWRSAVREEAMAMAMARLDDDDDDDDDGDESSEASRLVGASTSGRVESTFWDERQRRRRGRRRRRRRRVWVSPTGVLYVVSQPCNFEYNELEHGRKIEENVSIDIKHTVSTCFEQGRLGEEKSILMTTSHKMGTNHTLTTHYVNNLNGGYEYSCNTSHAILPASSRFYTCLNLTSIGDPTLEVELEQEKQSNKMSEIILANLRTGERFLKLQSKNNITDNVALSNTFITDLRRKHLVELAAALPLWGFANLSNSFTTDFQESYEFCSKVWQQINERNILKAEFLRNNNQISMEMQHVAQGTSDVAVKLIRNIQGTTQFKVTSSHTRQANCWGWSFRKVSGEAYSVGMEWKREVAPDKFLLLRTSTQNRSCTVFAELRRPF